MVCYLLTLSNWLPQMQLICFHMEQWGRIFSKEVSLFSCSCIFIFTRYIFTIHSWLWWSCSHEEKGPCSCVQPIRNDFIDHIIAVKNSHPPTNTIGGTKYNAYSSLGDSEGGLDGVGRLLGVVVRDGAVDVVRDVRRANLVVEPVEDRAVRPVDRQKGACQMWGTGGEGGGANGSRANLPTS